MSENLNLELNAAAKPIKQRARYTLEFKQNVVNRFLETKNYTQVRNEFNIPSFSTIRCWVSRHEEQGLEGLSRRSCRPHHQPKKTTKWIIDKIIGLKKEKPEMGSQSMSDHLKRFESVDLSKTTIGKVFKKNGLQDGDAGYAERSHFVKGDKDKRLEKNIEAELGTWERFSRPNPNDLWQTDIMSFYIRDLHPVYLISVLDDCSRFIVNWGLFKKQTADNVLEVLRGALAKHGCPKEVLTDQGAQFKHWKGVTEFERILKKLKIEHIKARSHHPQTMGKIERFHKTLHRELLDQHFFISQEQAVEKIARFIEHYNYARAHSALDGFTPSDKYFGVIDAVKKYLQDFKTPSNSMESSSEQISVGRKSRLYLMGKILDKDIRIQEIAGTLSFFVNNQVVKEINLVSSNIR